MKNRNKRSTDRQMRVQQSRLDRLFQKTVKLTKPLPSYQQLHTEACRYHGEFSMQSWRVIAYARHTYTNYDMLCGKVKVASAINSEICAGYKQQANDLIHTELRANLQTMTVKVGGDRNG
jgi:hypothetical protein